VIETAVFGRFHRILGQFWRRGAAGKNGLFKISGGPPFKRPAMGRFLLQASVE
jgi:hypothetical protein